MQFHIAAMRSGLGETLAVSPELLTKMRALRMDKIHTNKTSTSSNVEGRVRNTLQELSERNTTRLMMLMDSAPASGKTPSLLGAVAGLYGI